MVDQVIIILSPITGIFLGEVNNTATNSSSSSWWSAGGLFVIL